MLFLIPTLEVKEKSADLSWKNEQKGWKQEEAHDKKNQIHLKYNYQLKVFHFRFIHPTYKWLE